MTFDEMLTRVLKIVGILVGLLIIVSVFTTAF